MPRALTPRNIHLCKTNPGLRVRFELRSWFFSLTNDLKPLMRTFLASISLSVKGVFEGGPEEMRGGRDESIPVFPTGAQGG